MGKDPPCLEEVPGAGFHDAAFIIFRDLVVSLFVE
jgi:hypothetical protein